MEGHARPSGRGLRGKADRTIALGFSTPEAAWPLLTLFLCLSPLGSGDVGTYTLPVSRPRPAFLIREATDVQANLPAEQPTPCEEARLPKPHAHPRRPRDHRASPLQGTHHLVGLTVRSRDVRRVLAEGRPAHGRLVVLFVAPGSRDAAFIAARRVGGAVQRNRARRILREAWRQASAQGVEGSDVVLVAREAIRGAKTQDLVAEMNELVARAGSVAS
jgi:ribonuclease P protein component